MLGSAQEPRGRAELLELHDLGGGSQADKFVLRPETSPRLERGLELLHVDEPSVNLVHSRPVTHQKLARFRFELRLIELLLREASRVGAFAEDLSRLCDQGLTIGLLECRPRRLDRCHLGQEAVDLSVGRRSRRNSPAANEGPDESQPHRFPLCYNRTCPFLQTTASPTRSGPRNTVALSHGGSW